MTQREFRRKIMLHVRRLPPNLMGDVKEFLGDLKGQLNSTDEEKYLNMQDIFNSQREMRERHLFKLKYMIINGSSLLSVFFVTSVLSPRHIRWTLFMCNVTMLWFICAVITNNTKDPLAVPDFSRQASSMAADELWISFLAPFGSMILMFIVASFLKEPNSQILNVVTLRQFEASVMEYKKEQRVRFALGYSIVFTFMAFIFWYIIKFTSNYGWKVSWIWWYEGAGAIILQFFFFDPLLSIAHWGIYRMNKKAGRIVQKVRSISQGYNEAFDITDDEKERKQNKISQGGSPSKLQDDNKDQIVQGWSAGEPKNSPNVNENNNSYDDNVSVKKKKKGKKKKSADKKKQN